MSVKIIGEGFSIFKNDDEPYGSQKEALDRRTKFFETIRYSERDKFKININSIQ